MIPWLSILGILVILVLVAFCLYLLYNYYRNYTYWTKSGLPYIPFPKDSVFYPHYRVLTFQKLYNELAPHPVGGIYKMSLPFLMIRNPELIRRITIKDFSHFMDRGRVIDEELNPLNLMIFRLNGSRWKNVRNKITPAFSSAKIKGMWPYLEECKRTFEEYLDHRAEADGDIEVMEAFKKFGIDVIGTCVLGLECNAIQDENSEFRKTAYRIFRRSNLHFLRSFLRSTGLGFISMMKWKRVLPDVEDFFFSIVRESIKHRTENLAAKKQDFMQHLINIQQEELNILKKKGEEGEPLLTEAMIAGQVFMFFLAGFESTAGTLAYCLYELARQPEIAEKCREEVKEKIEQNGGTLTYESLNDLTYTQSVLDETLRIYPPLGWLERICCEPYKLPDSAYIVKKGERLIIPVYALHHDPQYFPDPEKFEPDRFNKKNIGNIIPGSYIPFGEGPRICPGIRFSFMQMKATLASLLLKYDVEPSVKTEYPLSFDRTMFLLAPKNGLWLRFKQRTTVTKL